MDAGVTLGHSFRIPPPTRHQLAVLKYNVHFEHFVVEPIVFVLAHFDVTLFLRIPLAVELGDLHYFCLLVLKQGLELHCVA